MPPDTLIPTKVYFCLFVFKFLIIETYLESLRRSNSLEPLFFA